MNKGLKIVVAVVVIAIIIWAVASNKKASVMDIGPIKIGGAFLLTGSAAALGEFQKSATQMAIDEVNAKGGINGRQVELVLQDTAYDPKKTIDAYQALKLDGVNYIIADGSPVVAAIRKLAVDDGKLIIAPGATTPAYFDGSNLSCRLALTAKNFGPGFAELLKKKGYKSAVALLPNNEYGKGLGEELMRGFAAAGLKLAAIESYDAAATAGDYRTNVAKLKTKQAEADALIVVQVANTVETMLKQIKDLGWTKPILSDYYTVQNPALKNLALAEGIDYIDYEYSREASPTDSDVAKAFKAGYEAKTGMKPVLLGAGHYEAVKLIMEGIEKAGDNPQKVADYISTLKDYKGVTGSLTFDSDCEVARNTVFRTVKGAKIVDLK